MALNRMITSTFAALLAGAFAVSASAHDDMMSGEAMTGASSGGSPQMAMQQRVQMWDADHYMRLQGAVEAQGLCRGKLSEPAMRAAVKTIESKTGEPESPGKKLTLLDQAKWDMKSYILDNGCAAPRAQQALSTFDGEVAPGMHGMMMK